MCWTAGRVSQSHAALYRFSLRRGNTCPYQPLSLVALLFAVRCLSQYKYYAKGCFNLKLLPYYPVAAQIYSTEIKNASSLCIIFHKWMILEINCVPPKCPLFKFYLLKSFFWATAHEAATRPDKSLVVTLRNALVHGLRSLTSNQHCGACRALFCASAHPFPVFVQRSHLWALVSAEHLVSCSSTRHLTLSWCGRKCVLKLQTVFTVIFPLNLAVLFKIFNILAWNVCVDVMMSLSILGAT